MNMTISEAKFEFLDQLDEHDQALARAVLKQVGSFEELYKIAKAGNDATNHLVHNFACHVHTVPFAEQHKALIFSHLKRFSCDQTLCEAVADLRMVDLDVQQVESALLLAQYSEDYVEVFHALAWWALNHVVYYLNQWCEDMGLIEELQIA
ncbi:MAG: hypothetical protein Q4D05_07660 [Acinetobacter sp.]|nr:hypothetical protein [Acinetobacter sp.]MDO4223885.1 hypothetical protein [Acinetobacter sp.]